MGAAVSEGMKERLAGAMWENRLVRFTTRFESNAIKGYVAGVGPRFFLMSIVSDRIWYEGFEAFRVEDVENLRDAPNRGFVETALRVRGDPRPDAAGLNLETTEQLLLTAAARFPLISLHHEVLDPEVCWIGRLVRVGGGVVTLREVGPGAEWLEELYDYRLDDLTRIGFGQDYEDALYRVAGEPPANG